jgi:hypothetical protein
VVPSKALAKLLSIHLKLLLHRQREEFFGLFKAVFEAVLIHSLGLFWLTLDMCSESEKTYVAGEIEKPILMGSLSNFLGHSLTIFEFVTEHATDINDWKLVIALRGIKFDHMLPTILQSDGGSLRHCGYVFSEFDLRVFYSISTLL